jgi:hypothetical protein
MAGERDKEVVLMLICAHCKSQSIVYDKEYLPGTGWISRPRCLKCGRDKFKEILLSNILETVVEHDEEGQSPLQVAGGIHKDIILTLSSELLQKEDKNMPEKQWKNQKCKIPGCKKEGAFHGYCGAHFTEEYGINYTRYCKLKTHRGEDPREVAKRVPDVRKQEKAKQEGGSNWVHLEQVRESPQTFGIKLLSGAHHIVIPCNEQILKTLKAQAEKDFRTIEQQAAYYIHEGLTRAGV